MTEIDAAWGRDYAKRGKKIKHQIRNQIKCFGWRRFVATCAYLVSLWFVFVLPFSFANFLSLCLRNKNKLHCGVLTRFHPCESICNSISTHFDLILLITCVCVQPCTESSTWSGATVFFFCRSVEGRSFHFICRNDLYLEFYRRFIDHHWRRREWHERHRNRSDKDPFAWCGPSTNDAWKLEFRVEASWFDVYRSHRILNRRRV